MSATPSQQPSRQQPSRQRVDDLLIEALELPAAERPAFLDQACGTDRALKREVLTLLDVDPGALNRLEQPAAALLETPPEPRIDRIGPYRIVRELGRGGMGRVFLARSPEKASGAGQHVAVKILRPGFERQELERRFAVEHRALSRLRHPRIARLLGGGWTDGYLPYLVMEYVEGEPIDRFCERRGLGLVERLELFLGVADAVRYAHSKRVAHRDLKPTNVLVTAAGEPRLLDFGIAKILAPDGTALSHTDLGRRLLTPGYASPEQVMGRRVTRATDIYSLGVLLYQLLTGVQPPALSSEIDDRDRLILVGDVAPPPSQHLTGSDRDAVAGLDPIVLRALEHDLERRYPAVETLLEELAEWRAGAGA